MSSSTTLSDKKNNLAITKQYCLWRSNIENNFQLNPHINKILKKYNMEDILPRINQNPGYNIYPSAEQEFGNKNTTTDNIFPESSTEFKAVSQFVNMLIDEFSNSSSPFAKEVKNIFEQARKENNFKIILWDDKEPDGFAVHNPKDHSIEIKLRKGLFTMFDKAACAAIIGHEIGHLIEHANRPIQFQGQHVNSKSVESFCDIVGQSLCAHSGYDTTSFEKFFDTLAEIEARKHNCQPKDIDDTYDKHPAPLYRKKTIQQLPKFSVTKNKDFTPEFIALMSKPTKSHLLSHQISSQGKSI